MKRLRDVGPTATWDMGMAPGEGPSVTIEHGAVLDVMWADGYGWITDSDIIIDPRDVRPVEP